MSNSSVSVASKLWSWPRCDGSFLPRPLGLAQVILQLPQALLAVLDALLDAGNVATHRIEAPLHRY